MTAKKQALLGIAAGALLAVVIVLVGAADRPASTNLLPMAVPLGMFYGFGYAFSGPILKKWLIWAAGASGTIATWALVSQLLFRRGLFLGLFLSLFLISAAVGLAYIPGLFIGIRRMWQESRV